MSYARWSDSDWYVFSPGDGTLDMWHCTDADLPRATFEQLDGITEDALAALVPNAPRAAISELLEYVQEFCAEVHADRAASKSKPEGS